MYTMEPRPTRLEVRDRLGSLISEIAGVPSDRMSEGATIDDELQMNSVAFVELQVAIEEEYSIQIDPIAVVELNRFGSIVDYIHRLATGGSP